MPNLPYSSTDWSTTIQHRPKDTSYPLNFGESPDKYAKVTRRFLEATSFSPTLPDRAEWTNLLTYSEDFSNAAWTKTSVTITANQVPNPQNGLVTGSAITDNSAVVEGRIERSLTVADDSVSRCLSIFVRDDGAVVSQLYARYTGGSQVEAAINFTWATKAVSTAAGGVTANVKNVGNGWYRIWFYVTNNSSGNTTLEYRFYPSTTAATTGSTRAWGTQVVVGTSPGPYVATTSTSRTISAPSTDYISNQSIDSDSDVFAFLAEESNPASAGPAGLVRYELAYARIPAPFYSPASMTFARPVLHDLKSGSSYAVSFDDGLTSHIFSSRIAVSAVGDVPALSATNAIFGSSLLSIGSTNGMSSVIGTHYAASGIAALLVTMGITATVVRTASSIAVSVLSTSTAKIKYVDALDTSIQVESNGELGFTISIAQPNAQTLKAVRSITTGSAHSGAAGGQLVAWNGDKIVGITKAVAASGSTLTVPVEGPFAVEDLAITHIAFASTGTRIAIEPPVTGASARTVQRFYLPGVSVGITDRADIPKFEVQTDPITFLGLVVSYLASPSEDTYFIAESGAVSRWMGPILMKEVTEIQMQDVIVQVTAGA